MNSNTYHYGKKAWDNAFFCTSVLLSLKTLNCYVCYFENFEILHNIQFFNITYS